MFPWNMFPFNQDSSPFLKNMQLPNINEQMNQALSQWMPEQWKDMFRQNGDTGTQNQQANQQKEHFNTNSIEVLDTFDFVFIHVQIKQQKWLENMKIFHTSHKAILKNFPDDGNSQVIALPSPVLRKGTTAQYRNGILEIRFSKKEETQMTEIDFHFD